MRAAKHYQRRPRELRRAEAFRREAARRIDETRCVRAEAGAIIPLNIFEKETYLSNR